jgi:hypothetical protein
MYYYHYYYYYYYWFSIVGPGSLIQFLNPIQNLWNSLDGGSARTYTQDNVNTG